MTLRSCEQLWHSYGWHVGTVEHMPLAVSFCAPKSNLIGFHVNLVTLDPCLTLLKHLYSLYRIQGPLRITLTHTLIRWNV